MEEPRAPEAQDISRLSRSTYYLALHQTIASTLKPLANFFDSREKEEEEEAPIQMLDEGRETAFRIENFEKIRRTINNLTDPPQKKLLNSQYRQFLQYFLNQSQFLEQSPAIPKETGFSSRFQRDFHSPFETGDFQRLLHNLPMGAELSWQDPLKETLFQLFLQILSPGDEKLLTQELSKKPISSSIPFMKNGVYNFLESFISHPLIPPVTQALLSDYKELSETRIDERQYQYVLRSREKDLQNLDVRYDLEKEAFYVKGFPFSKAIEKESYVHPRVIVNPETGWETRVYQYQKQPRFSVMEIEVFDTQAGMVMKSLERTTSDGHRETWELLYENRLLKESLLEIQIRDYMSIRRRFLYTFEPGGLLKDVSEQSNIVLPLLKGIGDLGLTELREARILESFCIGHRLHLENIALWIPQEGSRFSMVKRRIELKAPGVLKCFIEEEDSPADISYSLSSEIVDSRGQVIFRRKSVIDEEKGIHSLSIEDRRERYRWEQKSRFGKDSSLISIHSLYKESSDIEAMRGNISATSRNTHLLPGIIVCSYDKFYDRITHKDEMHFHHYFEKLIGSQWVKPRLVKKTDIGEYIVVFNYEPSPGCVVEEERHYSGDDLYEVSCHIKRRVDNERLLEEKLIKRSRERGEETIEIVRRKGDSEYRETTGIKSDFIDRYVRSRKRSEKAPIDFFSEPNRWLDFVPGNSQGITSFVGTYVHERIVPGKNPPDRKILIREETYECEVSGKRDILNFLAFLDEENNIHYRTKATSLRQDYERTVIWEDGELIQQYETLHKTKKKAHGALK